MIAPGDVQQHDDGFVFVPRGQPFFWTNPDFPVLSMDQGVQESNMSQADGGSLTGMGVPQLVDAARGVDDSDHALSGASSQYDVPSLHQQVTHGIHDFRVSGTLLPPFSAYTPEISNPSPTSFPGPFLDKPWEPVNHPTTPTTYGWEGYPSAGSVDDGTSALGKWYGDGTGVGKMSLGGSHEVGAISSPPRPAISVALDQRIKAYSRSLKDYTRAIAPSLVAFSNISEGDMRTANDRWNSQPPHTSDGTFARQQLPSRSEVEQTALGLWQDSTSSAASTSSASHAAHSMNTGFAIPEYNNLGSYSVAATSVQDAQLSGSLAFGTQGREGVQGQSVCTSGRSSIALD
jgi:hypothetical protein